MAIWYVDNLDLGLFGPGQFGPYFIFFWSIRTSESKVRIDQKSNGFKVRIDQRSNGFKVRIDQFLNGVKVRIDQCLNAFVDRF